MEVLLLGTGAADGWPNPFCTCASCQAQRAQGRHRVSTSALVDGVLLLDLGPDTPRQAERLGARLDRVRHVLVSHAHPDHLAPAALLWREWARAAGPLDVAGPAPVVAEIEPWLGTGSGVRLHTLDAGDALTLGGYAVRTVPGSHEVDCLLYDVTGPDGRRLLYATDTGPLSDAALAALDGAAVDLVLLEQTFGDRTDHGTGHHDLATFPRTLAALRASRAVHATTRVVAVHLGHHNPPEPELAERLRAWGAEPGVDGARLHLTGPPQQTPAQAAAHRTLLLGGARSGKSAAAEAMLAAEPVVVYVATSRPVRDDGGQDDPEWAARVAAHQRRRPPGWVTVETTDLEPLLTSPGPPLLVDCLTLWLTCVLDEADAWDSWPQAADTVEARMLGLREAWRGAQRHVVGVSNEVGSGVVPDTWSGRLFRDLLGRLNAWLAAESDEVRLLVAGLDVPLRPSAARTRAGTRPGTRSGTRSGAAAP
jgi:adenosylcobinamide kinase / adenosylcobinamide-phosphate guanylyltransferase